LSSQANELSHVNRIANIMIYRDMSNNYCKLL